MLFYLDGSPVERFVRDLSREHDCRVLPPSGFPERKQTTPVILLIDVSNGELAQAKKFKATHYGLEIVALANNDDLANLAMDSVYAYLPSDISSAILGKTIANAFAHLRLRQGQEKTASDLQEIAEELCELNEIGIKLSAERDTDALLELILSTAREITFSDAGSLYLVEEDKEGARWLRFMLAQNDSMPVPFKESTLPIGPQSLAGYVALTGTVLNLPNAYELPADSPFHINHSFDRQVGYHSKSMLVVPMKTPQSKVIGVFQLINCKRQHQQTFSSSEQIEREAIPFSQRYEDLAASLASQAAVALENSRLYQSVQNLFESFVRASVTAIEARDPSTAGHSFRVAELTVRLAEAVDRTTSGSYASARFTPSDIKELLYAAILHDFGKVGVRENILVKARKLYPEQLELIKHRAELIKQDIELRHVRNRIHYLLEQGNERYRSYVSIQDEELRELFREIDEYMKIIVTANEPSVERRDFTEEMQKIALRTFQDQLNRPRNLLTVQEAAFLSSPSGSIDPEERAHIQSHVTHTYTYLSQIPWTRELRRVPEIAFRHHERIDGSGYPRGLSGNEIPLQSKILMIADVFDALTAADRPYKSAVSLERALEVLRKEKQSGALDSALVELFIEARVYECLFPPHGQVTSQDFSLH
jgi:HD-GYP domain-containing protein (c-di-GMP phosphodiesterase class II)